MKILCLILFSALVFAISLVERRCWFGELSSEPHGHHWLTSSSLIWSRNWYREGAWTSGFALLDNAEEEYHEEKHTSGEEGIGSKSA